MALPSSSCLNLRSVDLFRQWNPKVSTALQGLSFLSFLFRAGNLLEAAQMFYTSNAETLLVSHRAMNTIWLESVHIARNSRKTCLAKRICLWAHEGPAARPSHVSGSGTHGVQWPGSDTSLLKASLGNMEVSLRIHTELALRRRLQIASATQWPPEFRGRRSIGSLCLCLKFWFLKLVIVYV